MSPHAPPATLPRDATSSPPAHMQLQSRLFRLPRELRDLIYGYYLFSETGFEYDLDKNKLTTANGGRIDLALTYTCRVAAAELRDLALRLNTVNFRTAYTDASRQSAGAFSDTLEQFHINQKGLLDQVASRCLTEEIENKINLVYLQFAPILREWRQVGDIPTLFGGSYGEPPSILRDFVSFALSFPRDSPHISKAYRRRTARDFRCLTTLHPDPWQIPDTETLEELVMFMNPDGERPGPRGPRKYSLSAATCAIRFLKSLPESTRAGLGQIDLHEDRRSITYPECHARGLIPFCQENRKLRVHRRVSLWWNVLWKLNPFEEKVGPGSVSALVSKWMDEAITLSDLGMPNEAFKMKFESDSAPEQTSKIFNVLQRDATWQDALDLGYKRKHLPTPTWFERRTRLGYISEALPQTLQRIGSQGFPIHCDFFTGNFCDPKTIVEERISSSVEQWTEKTFDHRAEWIQAPSNMPEWCVGWPSNP